SKIVVAAKIAANAAAEIFVAEKAAAAANDALATNMVSEVSLIQQLLAKEQSAIFNHQLE
ncbi:hypothetical protein ACJBXS_11955, partial [Streptococcus suis]